MKKMVKKILKVFLMFYITVFLFGIASFIAIELSMFISDLIILK